MSMSYWLISGIGVCSEDIDPFIDGEKAAHALLSLFPGDKELQDFIEEGEFDDFDVYEWLDGFNLDCVAELLAKLDDTEVLIYGNDGDGSSYLYYPPTMPWERRDNEPDSVEEVHRRLIKVVQSMTNLSDEEIEKMIDDDLYEVGMG